MDEGDLTDFCGEDMRAGDLVLVYGLFMGEEGGRGICCGAMVST